MSNKESLLCVGRIRASYDKLTNSEKRIADYILDNYSDVHGKSVSELAEATSTSPATISRFCKTIGFEGFMDFMLNMEHSTLGPDADTTRLEQNDSASVIKQKVLLFNQRAIDNMANMLDEVALETIADLLYNANRIVIFGDGGSGCSARNAYDVFLQMNLRCEYVSDPFFELMIISQMQKNDVLFTISNSGRSLNTIQNAQLAKEKGVTVVGMVGMPNTPLSKYLDVEFYTCVSTQTYFCDTVAARICELSILSVLHSMLLLRKVNEGIPHAGSWSKTLDIKRLPPHEKS